MTPNPRERAEAKRTIAGRARMHAEMLLPPDKDRLQQYADELDAEAVELERKTVKTVAQ